MQDARKEAVTKQVIGEEAVGQRLDNYLFKLLKGVPKSRVYRMLREGELRVNGRRAKPDQRLEMGDELRVPPVRTATRAEAAVQPAIGRSLLPRVLYRDEALLVLDKPAGQAVHGGSGVSLGVIEQLRRELPDCPFMELAHRLDKETSGILIIALKRAALVELHRMLREGEVRKTYLALATGRWRDKLRHVRLALRKYHTTGGERRVAVDEEGQFAHTVFSLVSQHGGPVGEFSLLEAELKTGRTHQIRVHLAALHHAIAGDDKYGDFEHNRALKKQGLKRMFLHAARIEFFHPVSGRRLAFQAPLPDDLGDFLASLDKAS
jgi:23S rRNA pseudouridine955/2504/2580 synthase